MSLNLPVSPETVFFHKRVVCKAMPQKLNRPRVLGVLAGGDFPVERLLGWVHSADIILAADGAANTLFSCGVLRHTTVGDMDSIDNSTKDVQMDLLQIDDQNTSDCDKLLSVAEARGYREITMVCAEGDLLDHVLGNLYSGARAGLKVRFAVRRGVAHILKGPEQATYEAPERTRLSLMPLGPCYGVNLTGVQWPLTDAMMSPAGLVSLSNRSTGSISVSLKAGTAALFLAHPELEVPSWPDHPISEPISQP